MKLRMINEEKGRADFDYESIAKDLWAEKIHDTKEDQRISFDTENDEEVEHRNITVDNPRENMEDNKVTFKCERRVASGDWECSITYFRCQLVDGYTETAVDVSDPFFCYIPGPQEGNGNLIPVEEGASKFMARHNNNMDSLMDSIEVKKCWESLENYLSVIATGD